MVLWATEDGFALSVAGPADTAAVEQLSAGADRTDVAAPLTAAALGRPLAASPGNYLALGTKLFPPDVIAKELAHGAGSRVAITLNFGREPAKAGAGDDANVIEGRPNPSER